MVNNFQSAYNTVFGVKNSWIGFPAMVRAIDIVSPIKFDTLTVDFINVKENTLLGGGLKMV